MMIPKKRLALLGLIFGLLILLLLAARSRQRFKPFSKPFSDLESADIAEVWIEFGGFPAYPLDQEDLDPLVEALRSVELYEQDDSYSGYDGTGYLWLRLKLSDGEEWLFKPCSPFFIINGTGYQTEYYACNAVAEIGYGYVDRIHAANPELSQPRLVPPIPGVDS